MSIIDHPDPKVRFIAMIRERWNIFLKKRSGKLKPWTHDEIMRKWKFCNIRRIDDRVSQWLLNNWYKPNAGHPNMALACVLARHLNAIGSLEAVGFPDTWDPERIDKILADRELRGETNFSAAYIITGSHGTRGRKEETKAYQVIYRVCEPFAKANPKFDGHSMMTAHVIMKQFPGFRDFLAGQVVSDFRHALPGEWSDKDTWAPVGPGSSRGLLRYFGERHHPDLKQHEWYIRFVEVMHHVRSEKHLPHLEAIDIQGCLCEFDKYERVRLGEGYPRSKYEGE